MGNFLLAVVSRLAYLVVLAFHKSYRYRFVGVENLQAARQASKYGNHIYAIWHQNLFVGITAQTGWTHVVMISKSKDARPLAYTLQRLGHMTMMGSSKSSSGVDKGGRAAKDQMTEILKTGVGGAITVDGPKGPAHYVKPGIVDMAKQAEVALVPYVAIADRYWVFNSWDKFRLPKPFAKIVIGYGRPISVSPTLPYENFRKVQDEIGASLVALEDALTPQFQNWEKLSKENIKVPGAN